MEQKNWVPHIVKDGARYHVISYQFGNSGMKMVCSERNCEMNKPRS